MLSDNDKKDEVWISREGSILITLDNNNFYTFIEAKKYLMNQGYDNNESTKYLRELVKYLSTDKLQFVPTLYRYK